MTSARIEELRKKFEENPRRYFAPLANEYRKAGDIEQAISICREYLPQQPGHMSGHIVYGQALYEARQFEESKSVFETALTLDPENLIALRHLGDIALIVGDIESARSWYRRVLEADPRNEEIQAQLARIDGGGEVSPQATAADAAAPAAPLTPPTPTPSSAPTVVQEAVKIPPKPQERVEIAAVAPSAPPAPAPVTATSPTEEVPRLELDSAVPGTVGGDAPPLDGFSLDGLETTSLASPPLPQTLSTSPTLELDQPVTNAVPAAPPESPAPPLMDLELSVPGESRAPEPPPAQAAASTNDLPLLDLNAPAEPAPAAAPESGPFVTETMAELYLKQGHRDEALKVYRALLEQRPGDASLQAKIAEIAEPEIPAPTSAAPAPTSTARPAASHASAGSHAPTIREILSLVATRRPGYRPEKAQNGGTPAALATAETGRTAALHGDALASLFGAGRISDTDEIAARTLALAFAANGTQGGSVDSMPGAPARVASTELSLDSVFSGGAAPAAPSNFSFDQFFSKNAAAEGHAAATQSGAESPDDVAKFTEWLQGLKQR